MMNAITMRRATRNGEDLAIEIWGVKHTLVLANYGSSETWHWRLRYRKIPN